MKPKPSLSGPTELGGDCLALARDTAYRASNFAKALHLHLRQVERCFHECKTTPQKWLSEVQMWDAALKLKQGERPKTMPCTLGFHSQSRFFHKFKDYHGCSPKQYLEICLPVEREEGSRLTKNLIAKTHQSLASRGGLVTPEQALEFLGTVPTRSRMLRIHLLRYRYHRKATYVAIQQQVSP